MDETQRCLIWRWVLVNLLKFLGDRLDNKSIKMVVKTPDCRELNLEANS
ncbi:MAG TPA: hypothetical protein VE956_02815 [Nodularia sp. (in: cyanobacteria)]|nr:hypothetical protein [Nodularia sp. (in: cyanobacteria)]